MKSYRTDNFFVRNLVDFSCIWCGFENWDGLKNVSAHTLILQLISHDALYVKSKND